jgi:hypothetical protein
MNTEEFSNRRSICPVAEEEFGCGGREIAPVTTKSTPQKQ